MPWTWSLKGLDGVDLIPIENQDCSGGVQMVACLLLLYHFYSTCKNNNFQRMGNKCDGLVSFSAGYSNKSESSKLKANCPKGNIQNPCVCVTVLTSPTWVWLYENLKGFRYFSIMPAENISHHLECEGLVNVLCDPSDLLTCSCRAQSKRKYHFLSSRCVLPPQNQTVFLQREY